MLISDFHVKPNAMNDVNNTEFHLLYSNVCLIFLTVGLIITSTNTVQNDFQPLHSASLNGHETVVQLLINVHDVDPNIREVC